MVNAKLVRFYWDGRIQMRKAGPLVSRLTRDPGVLISFKTYYQNRTLCAQLLSTFLLHLFLINLLTMSSKMPASKNQRGPGRATRPPKKRRQQKQSRVAQAPRAVSSAPAPRSSLLQGSYESELARSYVLPGDVVTPLVAPSDAPCLVTPRVIKKTYTSTSSNVSPEGNSVIVMDPHASSPAYILTSDPHFVPEAPGALSMVVEDLHSKGDGTRLTLSHAEIEAADESAVKAIPSPVTVAGVTYNCYPINFITNGSIDYQITKTKEHSGGFFVNFVSTNGAAWGVWSSPMVKTQNVSDTVTGSFTVTAGDTGLGFFFTDESGTPIVDHNDIHVNIRASIATTIGQRCQYYSTGAVASLFRKVPKKLIDLGVDTIRIKSMAMLISNVAAPLNQQGEIIVARVNRDVLSRWADLETSLSQLPSNRFYQGPAAYGGYAWWMPDNVILNNPGNLRDYSQALLKEEVLVALIKGQPVAAGASSFRIQFAWNIEFFTSNQLFEKVRTPEMSARHASMLGRLAALPAASCNPEHENLFKSYMKKAADLAGSAYAHYGDNKVFYDTALKLLAGILL